MKDSDQKDDYYSVSKQPPMAMDAPPPPPPMGMPPMGMPMGGPMPPGAPPMPPQEEELQEGEYIDQATGKVMRRGEEFSVDPDRELDDTKNIAKWFKTLQREDVDIRKFLGRFRKPQQQAQQQTQGGADSYFSPEALQQQATEFQNRIGSMRSLQDLYGFILGLEGNGVASEAWEQNSQGRFSLNDQINSLKETPVEALLEEISRQVPGMMSYNYPDAEISRYILGPLSEMFSRTFGIRDKALALMQPEMDKAIQAAKPQQTSLTQFDPNMQQKSWFVEVLRP
jgi:hypothetical protein